LAASLELPTPEALFWTLRHLCHNSRGYRAEGDWGNPESLRFQHTDP
jgi:glucose-6-phosphate isomerase